MWRIGTTSLSPVSGALTEFWQAGLDLFFPPVCAGCGALGWDFCSTCAQAVMPTPGTICAQCGRVQAAAIPQCSRCRAGAMEGLVAVRSAAQFQAPLRAAIHAFKYAGQPHLATPLARYLTVTFAQGIWSRVGKQIDAVVPVPLHADRSGVRGYNQSELLAQAFCAQAGLRHAPDWIGRTRATRPQVGLGVGERRANVAGAFAADAAVQDKAILLIDDVFTTGATLQACATAALDAGARRVYGLTLAAAAGVSADG